jgi:hypothetical protein
LIDGYYISDAAFTSDEAGSFEMGYDVIMRAGKSHITWQGGEQGLRW